MRGARGWREMGKLKNLKNFASKMRKNGQNFKNFSPPAPFGIAGTQFPLLITKQLLQVFNLFITGKKIGLPRQKILVTRLYFYEHVFNILRRFIATK